MFRATIIIVFTLVSALAHAHESPAHTIQKLNKHPESAQTLHRRAIAHRAIHQHQKAIEDLQKAITREPKNLALHIELIRTHLTTQHFGKALHTANHALTLAQSKTPAARATLHILRAEALPSNPALSLKACQQAFQEIPQGEIEWFLLRSENQRTLGIHAARITDLRHGHKLHHSAVLKSHLIDALIDASEFQTALPLINAALTDRRWKSSYLIKRARTLQGLHRQKEATTDLHTALTELNTRLHPTRPDLLLLADQGIALAMLDDHPAAHLSLKKLQHHHAPRWIIARLQEILTKP